MLSTKADAVPTADACQLAVASLILMVENQTAAPLNPRSIVEMWHRAGPCDALFAGRPVAERQNRYLAALGPELYDLIASGAELPEGAKAPLSSAHSRHLNRVASRHFSGDLDALYPLLTTRTRERFGRSPLRVKRLSETFALGLAPDDSRCIDNRSSR